MVWKICDGVLPGMRDLRDTEPKPRIRWAQWGESIFSDVVIYRCLRLVRLRLVQLSVDR